MYKKRNGYKLGQNNEEAIKKDSKVITRKKQNKTKTG